MQGIGFSDCPRIALCMAALALLRPAALLAQPAAALMLPRVEPAASPPQSTTAPAAPAEKLKMPQPTEISTPPASARPEDRPMPINLPTAFQLVNARALDISIASQQIQAASAQLARAQVLWLPNIQMGADYYRHDGQIQAVDGTVFGTSRSSFMLGAAPIAVFAVTDAVFGPLVARQVQLARESDRQTATNDSVLAVATAYFDVQQARGELAGALDSARRADEVARRTGDLAKGLAAPVDAVRARAEAARRRQTVQVAYARWRSASAELARILRLDASSIVEPMEPPQLQINLIAPDQPVDNLIPIALVNRPELASQQALVQAALERMRQERMRPLMPSVLLRGAATQPTGTLAGGWFGGGINGNLSNFGARNDMDIQLLWELQNLGFGNRARVNESRAQHRQALLEQLRLQDRVAAEVVQAHADLQSAAVRIKESETELREAIESADKNFDGMNQTRNAGNVVLLVIRPQEVVAAVQALAQAYTDYYGAVGDYNRAQFRLYRALGQPAQLIEADLAEKRCLAAANSQPPAQPINDHPAMPQPR
jgi:outer membrane protein TolC